MQWIETGVIIGYVLMLIIVANRMDGRRFVQKRRVLLSYPYTLTDTAGTLTVNNAPENNRDGLLSVMLMGAVTIMLLFGVGALMSAVVPVPAPDEGPEITTSTALTVAMIGVLSGIFCSGLVFYRPLRERIARLIGNRGRFNPDSAVHKTAFVLATLFLAFTFMRILVEGGVTGFAETLEEQPVGVADTLMGLFAMLILAFAGVGLTVRRPLAAVFERLALRFPTLEDVLWGIGTAFMCLFAIVMFSSVLVLVFSPEALEQQGAASEQIARALGSSLTLAFLAAFSAAVGEEILFRGALQPVFGLVLTTAFFALLHTQYAFTPGSLAIVLVGAAFGILKERYSTTAAIIAHFTYNFILLGSAYFLLQAEEAGLLPEGMESIILVASLILPF